MEKAEKKTKKPAATKKSRKAESDAEEDVIFRGELRQGIDMFCVEWRRIQGPTDHAQLPQISELKPSQIFWR